MTPRRTLVGSTALLLIVFAMVPTAVTSQDDGESEAVPDDPASLVADVGLEIPEASSHRLTVAGVPVFVASDPLLPLVDVAVAVSVGGWHDPDDRVGLAGLTAAMLRRGGTRALAPEALDERLGELAVEVRSVGLERRSVATLDAPRPVLGEALALFFDILATPRFDRDALRLAKRTSLANMRHRGDDAALVASDEWRRLVLGDGHPATRAVTAADLQRIDRGGLLTCHRRAWRPAAAVVAVSGDVDAEHVAELLRPHLERWSRAVGETEPLATLEIASAAERPGLFHVESSGSGAVVVLGHRVDVEVAAGSRRDAEIRLLAEIVGGHGAVSRLDARLRTVEGLVYAVDTGFAAGEEGPGLFDVEFEVGVADVGPALAAAIEELERLRRREPSELEVETARRELLAGIQRRFDSAEGVAGSLAEDALLHRRPGHRTRLQRQLHQLGPKDLRRVARRLLEPERATIVIVGPWEGIGRSLRRAELPDWVDVADVVHLPRREPLTWEPSSDG